MKTAILIHVFYLDVLEDILEKLDKVYTNFDLFITTQEYKRTEVINILKKFSFNSFVDIYENRGRDILPFLKTLDKRLVGYDVFLKLHTKLDSVWRNDLINPLLDSSLLLEFENNPSLGILAPFGHVLPFGQGTSEIMKKQAQNIFADIDDMDVFVAGTMFYGRVDAFYPLFNFNKYELFEAKNHEDNDQFAHVIERIFVKCVQSCDKFLMDSNRKIINNLDDLDLDSCFYFKYKNINIKKPNVICYYLPQFHAIPENDYWWGDNFTEWDNVKKGKPLYEGHYQPRVPLNGYYNLLDYNILKNQIFLAKKYGIFGFCFYYYWFNGKRLLEKPLEMFLKDISLDMPFCLLWANENWTRRWDGQENEVLIHQEYSDEDDVNFISSLKDYFLDSRYIRIDGKPVVGIYLASKLPNAKQTTDRWRKWCRENGIGEIYLINALAYGDCNFEGFDCSVEFPPHQTHTPRIEKFCDPNKTVYDYSELQCTNRSFNHFKGVMPSWDNAARRVKYGATVFHGSTPNLYQEWLEDSLKKSHKNLVFVNAWNEWGEGAYLEPDLEYKYEYLEATHNALNNVKRYLWLNK